MAEGVIRELSSGFSSVQADVAAVANVANERIGQLENALELERQRQNELSRADIQEAGRLDSVRSILDQRLDIVETTLETLRVASREESGARRQVADDVALVKTELRQMIAEETQALRHMIKSGPGAMGGPPMPPLNNLSLSIDSAVQMLPDGAQVVGEGGQMMMSPRAMAAGGQAGGRQGQWRAALADDKADSLVRMFSERLGG